MCKIQIQKKNRKERNTKCVYGVGVRRPILSSNIDDGVPRDNYNSTLMDIFWVKNMYLSGGMSSTYHKLFSYVPAKNIR